MKPAHRGMTLIEVVIAMSIFVTVMVAVLESLTSTQRYAASGEAQDDLNAEAMRMLDEISMDLTASGWLLPHAVGSNSPVSPANTSYTAFADDRKLCYYPFVQLQKTASARTEGLGTEFKHTWRSDSLAGPVIPSEVAAFLPGVPTDRTRLFGLSARTDFQASFFARSQELIFLKATIADWDVSKDQAGSQVSGRPALFFGGSRADWATQLTDATAEETKRKRIRALYACGWAPTYNSAGDISSYAARNVYAYAGSTASKIGTATNAPYGVVMESGYLRDPSNDLAAIDVNWRTQTGGGYTTTQQDTDDLREYMYAVVPSPVGLGRLVRARSVAFETAPAIPAYPDIGSAISWADGRAMVVEQVFSDNVVRIVFDTWRTVDQQDPVPTDLTKYSVQTLDINLVRVRLYVARRIAGGGPVLSRILDRVITLRARNSNTDKDFDAAGSSASLLGRQPIGISF